MKRRIRIEKNIFGDITRCEIVERRGDFFDELFSDDEEVVIVEEPVFSVSAVDATEEMDGATGGLLGAFLGGLIGAAVELGAKRRARKKAEKKDKKKTA